MPFGQKLKVYTDHKNLAQDALGLTSDCVYRWQLLITEYSPEIIYIKGIDNTVADAIGRLDYNPDLNHHLHDDEEMSKGAKWNRLLTLLSQYQPEDNDEQNNNYKQNYSQ
eukprot:8576118-Ditylum_brightwellii.AAC.1